MRSSLCVAMSEREATAPAAMSVLRSEAASPMALTRSAITEVAASLGYSEQEESVLELASGKDVFVCYGKSLCYIILPYVYSTGCFTIISINEEFHIKVGQC